VPTLAFCPCAPVLVPEVARGAAPETAAVLAACDAAVADLASQDGSVLVVGPAPSHQVYDGAAGGSFAGLGVSLTAGGAGPANRTGARLPLSLTMGAWLLDRAGVPVTRRRYLAVGQGRDASTASMATFVAADAWLVMGDSTARLSERAPGSLDPAAAAFDATVVAALASGDPAALAALDPVGGARLLAAGVPAWRCVGTALLAVKGADRRWSAAVRAHEAPYGVSYVVASWS
jgi:hypothetical protein